MSGTIAEIKAVDEEQLHCFGKCHTNGQQQDIKPARYRTSIRETWKRVPTADADIVIAPFCKMAPRRQ